MDNEIGKTLSFYQMMRDSDLKVEIPIIQRDYAQGREGASDIRTNFLRSIKKHLDENKPLNLDFVFGSIEDNKFIPIDGQQRLTTLFLLHWYLAWASENIEHATEYLSNASSRFTYETRISSRDFCNALVGQTVEKSEGSPISQTIKNQHWYYLNWRHDATISGMLNTLDTIEEIFDNPTFYYHQLTQQQPSLITFQYIELKDFGLSDQLYIKMNSRGKPLTAFENLKANVEQVFEEYDRANSTKHTFWLTSNIDGRWTDLFWSQLEDKSGLVDSLFMNFLRASLVNYYALKEGADLDKLRRLLELKSTFNFYTIEALDLNQFKPLFNAFQELESLIGDSGKLNLPIGNELIDIEELFKEIINTSQAPSLPKRIQFFALCQLLKSGADKERIYELMRVVRNLSENSRIEDADRFTDALKTTVLLLGQPGNLDDFLINTEPSALTGFSNYQSNEEILKARLLKFNPEWRKPIESFENHDYLNGQIGFILDFCGVEDAIKKNHTSPLKPSIHKRSMDSFEFYEATFLSVFKEDGIREFDDFLFERALLSVGDYPLYTKSNYSFLVNGNDRDISWKRWLRDDNRASLQDLFDRIDIDGVEESLQQLIDEYKEKEDYRYYFIKYPDVMAQTGKNKFIRFNDDNDILLLEKTKLNGTHREYYTYAICCELEEKGFEVEYIPNTSEDAPKFICSINEKAILIICFTVEEDRYYSVTSDLFDEDYDFAKHEEVIEFIEAVLF